MLDPIHPLTFLEDTNYHVDVTTYTGQIKAFTFVKCIVLLGFHADFANFAKLLLRSCSLKGAYGCLGFESGLSTFCFISSQCLLHFPSFIRFWFIVGTSLTVKWSKAAWQRKRHLQFQSTTLASSFQLIVFVPSVKKTTEQAGCVAFPWDQTWYVGWWSLSFPCLGSADTPISPACPPFLPVDIRSREEACGHCPLCIQMRVFKSTLGKSNIQDYQTVYKMPKKLTVEDIKRLIFHYDYTCLQFTGMIFCNFMSLH